MRYDCSNDKVGKGNIFDPGRFKIEPNDSKSVLTWGAGIHLCPGKQFAIYEIKMALFLITKHFHRFIINEQEYKNLNFFSPSAHRHMMKEFYMLD